MIGKLTLILTFVFLLGFTSCRIGYSFSGASLSPEMKTISVQFFPNQAPLFQPTLSTVFTEALKNRMTSQTSLELINNSADLDFQGEITNYSTTPMAIQGNETAGLNRLTISVHVKFTNQKNPKLNFDKTFSQFADYESSQALSSVENDLIQQIVDKLTEDVFNAALTNW
jgi:hypothetical protein